MPFTHNATVSEKDPRTGIASPKHVNDYVLLSYAAPEEYIDAAGRPRIRYTQPQNIYVQHGRIYRNGEEELSHDEAPAWFWEQYARITPETRRLVGLKLPEDIKRETEEQARNVMAQFDQLPDDLKQALAAKLGIQAPRIDEKAPEILSPCADESPLYPELKNDPEAPRPRTWTCEHCQEEMPLTHKGTHVARYRKLGRCS